MAQSNSFLHSAGNLFKGDLADHKEALDTARDAANGTRWQIGVYLICHAGTDVFGKDYSRALAKKFKDDVVAEFGVSAKQAGKWTEAISAALGVRGLRKGVQPIEGLMAMAKTGPEDVRDFLNAREIKTWNQFMGATRAHKDEVQALASKVHMLSKSQRERLQKIVGQLDKDEDGDAE